MTGEVEVYEPQILNELEQFASDLTVAYQIAARLVTTSFVPATYKGRPEEAAAAIMAGAEVGLSVLASLRSIDIIGGVPATRAVALRAIVQSAGHEIWTEEQTAVMAVVKGRRRGSDKVETSTWTIDRARELQLLAKDNWRKQPTAMLLARATSECARLIAADAILGIPYSTEELEDLGQVEASVVGDAPRKAPARRTVKRAAAPRSSEPELPGEEPKAIESADAPGGEADVAIASEEARLAEVKRERDEVLADVRDEAAVAEAARRAFEEPELEWGPGTEPEAS